MEVNIEYSFSFSQSFDNKTLIFIRNKLITFGHCPTQYFQTACVESFTAKNAGHHMLKF